MPTCVSNADVCVRKCGKGHTRAPLPERRPKFNVAALLEEEDKNEDGRALVKEQCPVCNHDEAKYSTLQVRQAPEKSPARRNPRVSQTLCPRIFTIFTPYHKPNPAVGHLATVRRGDA